MSRVRVWVTRVKVGLCRVNSVWVSKEDHHFLGQYRIILFRDRDTQV